MPFPTLTNWTVVATFIVLVAGTVVRMTRGPSRLRVIQLAAVSVVVAFLLVNWVAGSHFHHVERREGLFFVHIEFWWQVTGYVCAQLGFLCFVVAFLWEAVRSDIHSTSGRRYRQDAQCVENQD